MKESGDGPGREAMIVVDHLSRYYGPSPALQDLSFRAYEGEILGFLGPNGAGKTTTMRIITGYMPPSSGTATIAGYDVVSDSMEARKRIGYLPESTPLYGEMSVYGYLDFMARLRGLRERHRAVEAAMEKVSISDRADQLVSQLSKGLRQRVGIAQALLHDPPVIILDEPTIGLDPRQIREVRDLIAELRGSHTVILSTHILFEAQQLCDRVLIINRGRIVAEDAPENLTLAMSGGDRVRVSVGSAAPVDQVDAALLAIDGVQTVDRQADGVFVVAAPAGVAESVRPLIARGVVERGWPLLELSPLGVTLEDIFLELTGDEEAAAELAADTGGSADGTETAPEEEVEVNDA